MKTARPRRRLLKTAAIAFATLITFVVCSFIDPPTYEIEYSLPTDSTRLVARFTPMHPYLAEYERSLVVVRSDGTRTEVKLFPDTGGYRRAQLYQAEDGSMYFKGYFDVARIDSSTREVSVVSSAIPAGTRYLGAFDYVRDIGWKFLPPAESPEQTLEAIGGSQPQ